MGFHICEYCRAEGAERPVMSSGDVRMTFINGHSYVVPDMILHYVRSHDYLPPAPFVQDVMQVEMVTDTRAQAKAAGRSETVGFLKGNYPQGAAPAGFTDRLHILMQTAANAGERTQYRGMHLDR